METCKYSSLGEITKALFELGGAVYEEYVILDLRKTIGIKILKH
jgi:hypothetical protein